MSSKIRFAFLCLAFFIMLLPGMIDAAEKSIFETIKPEDAKELIENKKNLLMIDVRNPDELKSGFIEDSYLTPFWDIAKGKFRFPKDRPILVICAVGGRSRVVGQYLASTGYPEVYNMEGGISAWKKAGLPVKY